MEPTTRSPLSADAAFEQPTIFVLGKIVTPADKALLEGLKAAASGHDVAIKQLDPTPERRAALKLTDKSVVAVVLDRRGREQGRSSELAEVVKLAMQAAQVGRIDWAMDGTPIGEQAARLGRVPNVERLPGIMRAMSLNPDAMAGMIQMAYRMHFTDGALPTRTKELIATYVSSLNQCPFCLTSHAGFLAKKGQDRKDVDAVAMGDPSKAPGLLPKERELLNYVKKLTQEPWKVRDADIETLRTAGWNDAQIYEASFVVSLFCFYNRMANAYGLPVDPNGWRPPTSGSSTG